MSNHRDYDEQNESRSSMIRAREKAVKAHSVVIKFKELGLPEDMDSELDKLINRSGDWAQVANTMVDIQARLDHLAWHVKSIRRPLNRLTTYSYRCS